MNSSIPKAEDLKVSFHRSDEQNHAEYTRSLQKAIDSGRLTEDDRKLINSFVSEAAGQNDISTGRQLKICRSLILWRTFVGEYRSLDYSDIMIGIREIKEAKSQRGRKFKPNTLRDHVMFLKRFALWLIDESIIDVSEKKVRKITAPAADKMTKSVGDILTFDEVRRMTAACTSSRDRALISMIYEGAFRVGEIGSMTWKDVEFRSTGLVVNTDYKTGVPRRVPLANSTAYLSAWKDDYPYPITPDMPVFLTMVNNSPKDIPGKRDPDRITHKGLSYAGVRKQIGIIAKRAGIEKHLTPHIFRHSRITHLVKGGYPESYIKQVCWGSLTSEMLSTYLHLDNSYIDDTFYKFEGIKPEEEFKKDSIEARQCLRCAHINSSESSFCRKCGLPLDDETSQTLQLLSAQIEKSMMKKLQEDPEQFKKIVEQFL